MAAITTLVVACIGMEILHATCDVLHLVSRGTNDDPGNFAPGSSATTTALTEEMVSYDADGVG